MVEAASPTIVPFIAQDDAQLTFKVLCLGESQVGKSSVIDSFISGQACQQPSSNPSQQSSSKFMPMIMKDTSEVGIELCETNLPFANVESWFCNGAVGAFVVFDLTNRTTFEAL